MSQEDCHTIHQSISSISYGHCISTHSTDTLSNHFAPGSPIIKITYTLFIFSTVGWVRTTDLQDMNLSLSPTELQRYGQVPGFAPTFYNLIPLHLAGISMELVLLLTSKPHRRCTWWAGQDSNLRRPFGRQIYSLLRLTTPPPTHFQVYPWCLHLLLIIVAEILYRTALKFVGWILTNLLPVKSRASTKPKASTIFCTIYWNRTNLLCMYIQ